jgi:signal-transduction protein with cAMP-binding, CBS, and nucleotidyltransferase domain
MIIKELVTGELVPLMTSDSCEQALSRMDEYKVQHLPVVNNRELLGLISEYDITSHNIPDDPIGAVPLSLSNAFLTEAQHVFDAFKMITEMKLSLIPVIGSKDNYLGVVLLPGLLNYFANNSSMLNPGGIIVLQMADSSYSMTEISHIVESNDAKILNMCLNSHEESTQIEITLKLNVLDIVPVTQTFQRYNYSIKATFGERDDLDDLRDRFDALMNYLNI